MIINEIKGNLFNVNTNDFILAHCISRDCKMSMGIAREFNKRFPNMKQFLLYNLIYEPTLTAIPYNNGSIVTINLITKEKYYHKPTLDSVRTSIISLREICVKYNFDKLAVPKIGCGLDKLNWNDVKSILIEELSDAIDILNIYSL